MGNEASSAAERQQQLLQSQLIHGRFTGGGVGGGGGGSGAYSVNRPIGSDSSPPQSSFSINTTAQASSFDEASGSGKLQQQQQPPQQHRIIVVNQGPRPDAVSDELRALATLPTFLPLIKSSAASSAASTVATSEAVAAPSASGVDHRSLLHFCARYQEHLKQCAEAVAFDQNSLCGRIKELDSGAKVIQDCLQERHKRFQRQAEQIRKVTELRNLLARMRSHAKHLATMMEELNLQLPADSQLEPFSWQSTLPQQPQQQQQQPASRTQFSSN